MIIHETGDPVAMALRFVGSVIIVLAYERAGYLGSTITHAVHNFSLMAPSFLTAAFGLHPEPATHLFYLALLGATLLMLKKGPSKQKGDALAR